MAIFVYKGYDAKTGALRKGRVEAESAKAARHKLRTKEKVIPSELKEEVKLTRAKTGGTLLGSGVGLGDVALMSRQFATLHQAQVPLDECLKALTQQVENAVLRNALSEIKELISEGKSLADAFGKFPGIFDRLYVNMIRAGETSGSLGLVLERLADFQENSIAVRGKIVSAMAYPGIMITAAILIIGYLFVSVVPKLEKVFSSLKVTLPWYTKAVISFSNFLQSSWYLVIGGVVVLLFLFRTWYRTHSGRRQFDRFAMRAPLFGGLVLRTNVSKFTKTLSTLLSSGVPIMNALEITKNVIANSIVADLVGEARQAVQEGESLAEVIARGEVFPPLVSHMIRTGEKTGQLEQMLHHVAVAYDAEVERKIDTMISMIEPLMIILMGGIVVLVVGSMLLPMFSIMNSVGV